MFDFLSKRDKDLLKRGPKKAKVEAANKTADGLTMESKINISNELSVSNLRDEFITKTKNTTIEGTILPGSTLDKKIIKSKDYLTSHEIKTLSYEAGVVFKNALKDRLVASKITDMVVEACPIDANLKEIPDMKQFIFEATMDIYKDLCEFRKVNYENVHSKFIDTVANIYQAADDIATFEADCRFHPNRIINEAGGYIAENIKNYIKLQMENVSITHSAAGEYFDGISKLYAEENTEVVEDIKGKVVEEINNYKEHQKEMEDIKNGIKAETTPVEEQTPDTTSSDVPPEGENPVNNTPPTEATGDTPTETPPEGTEETPPVEGEPTDGESKTSAEKEPTPAEESAKLKNGIKVAIEGAQTFAENRSHTHNTGNEGYEKIFADLSNAFNNALNNNNVKVMAEVIEYVKQTTASITAVNEETNGKYATTLKKFTDLRDSIAAEISKINKSNIQKVRDNKTVLESMVVGISNRYLNKKGDVTTEGVNTLPAKKIIVESMIYYTIMESFNTLKILNLEDAKEKDYLKKFLTYISK